jgi:hypothetical protein
MTNNNDNQRSRFIPRVDLLDRLNGLLMIAMSGTGNADFQRGYTLALLAVAESTGLSGEFLVRSREVRALRGRGEVLLGKEEVCTD